MAKVLNTGIAEKVLDYWFTVEFLAQDKYPTFTKDMEKTIAELKNGTSRRKTASHFLLFDKNTGADVYEAIYTETNACKMTCWSNLTFYVGTVKREFCIQNIAKSLNYQGERPEKSTDEIAWVSFQLSPEGKYIERTLSISTIIWALNKIKKAGKQISSAINIKDYDDDIEKLEEKFFDEICIYTKEVEEGASASVNNKGSQFDANAVSFESIKNIFSYIFENYLKGNIEEVDGETPYKEVFGVSFDMYKDEATRSKADEDDYLGLSYNFFSDDIKLLLEKVKNRSLIDENLNKSLIGYINEPYEKKYQNKDRIDLVHPADLSILEGQVNDILDIRNAPIGKWPSKFSPAFMQQAAINLQIGKGKKDNNVNGTVFSVNGPPGTGKTTLLKEIVVNNVVERAILLAAYEDPDKAFVEHTFKKGDKEGNAYSKFIKKWYSLENDKINNYSMLVTSCNNTAVENISKELPKGSSIIDDLQSAEDDPEEYKAALKKIEQLFDVKTTGNVETDKSGNDFKDIYFSKHAGALLQDESAWGLIAAALGKKPNVNNFYNEVLSPIIFSDFYWNKDNARERIEDFKKAKKDFNEQLEKVNKIKEQLGGLCDLAKNRCKAKRELESIRKKNQGLIFDDENEVRNIENEYALIQNEQQKSTAVFSSKNAIYIDCKKASEDVDTVCKTKNTFIMECQQKEFETRKSVGFLTRIFNKKKYVNAMQVAGNYAFQAQNIQEELVVLNERLYSVSMQLQTAYSDMKRAEEEKQQASARLTSNRERLSNTYKRIEQLKAEIEKLENTYSVYSISFEKKVDEQSSKGMMEKPTVMDDAFINDLFSMEEESSTRAQVSNPWSSKLYDCERAKLFNYAMRLNKEFILSTNKCRDNYKTLAQYWGLLQGDDKERIRFHNDDKEEFVGALFQTLFLLVPVISSTFASVGRLFKNVKQSGVIGTLIVDEAGQAQPQMAIGALYRSRKAMIVGDPKQVEPVVTDDLDLLKKVFNQDEIKPYSSDKTVSVQGFADAINRFGTYLEKPGQDEDTWVGCPLLVHRRCISPMYDISNVISYNGIMKQQTRKPKEKVAENFVYNKSQWINIEGKEKGNKNHFVKEQGEKVCEILDIAFSKDDYPDLYIISPFTTVVSGVISAIKNHFKSNTKVHDNLADWLDKNIGTVHKFQGKEANEVVFLLGCDKSKESDGAIKWVNTNIVNVAVTRAKHRLYVVGDIKAWEKSSCVSQAKNIIDTFALKEINVIKKSNLTPEEQSKVLNEVADALPTIDSFSVNRVVSDDGEIDYSVDTTSWIKGLNQDFMKYDLMPEQIEPFGFQSLDEINRLSSNVSKNLIMGIKLYWLLLPVYKINQQMDASCCAILFCKAIELQIKESLMEPIKRLLPDLMMKGNGKGREQISIKDARDNEFTLGAFVAIIKKNKPILGKRMLMSGRKEYDLQWWNSFEDKLKDCTNRRNNCCHSGMFTWKDQEWLRFDMFFDDNKSPSVKRNPGIGGLMFESSVVKNLL